MTENFFLTSPEKIFNSEQVKQRMHEILHSNLQNEIYDADRCASIVQNLSNSIKDALKTFDYDRYKFIVEIHLCEEQNENLQVACRSYWDSETDRFAQSIYINRFFICVATTFAVFYY